MLGMLVSVQKLSTERHFVASILRNNTFVFLKLLCSFVYPWFLYNIRSVTGMGAIRWGTRGMCPPTFSTGGDIICHVPPLFSV